MKLKAIFGIGNPGLEHKNTYHNAGFLFIDYLKKDSEISSKFRLLKSNVFMNDSGKAIQKILNWFKVEPKDLIVVHDEVALDLGKIRVSFNSGAGGHHGIESTIQMLSGTEEFTRLRIGVGPDPGGDKRADYVLRKFSTQEEPFIKQVVNVSLQAIETIIMKDVGEAMNKFNGTEIKS